jgi:hypothetical protein
MSLTLLFGGISAGQAALLQEARRVRELYALELQMMSEKFPSRVRALSMALSHGGIKPAFRLTPQVLPRLLYHNLRAMKWKALRYLRENIHR